MTDEGAMNLSAAIIERAIKDLKGKSRYWKNDAKRFLESQNARDISLLDVDFIMNEVERIERQNEEKN